MEGAMMDEGFPFLPTLVCTVHSMQVAVNPSQAFMLHENREKQGCPD